MGITGISEMNKLVSDVNALVGNYIDTHVYNLDDWELRGESVGNGSLCTIVAEGELYHLLNGYRRATKRDVSYEKLDKLAAKYGCYVEQGFAWSWHFYRKDFA